MSLNIELILPCLYKLETISMDLGYTFLKDFNNLMVRIVCCIS
jgi:hypothetical protein